MSLFGCSNVKNTKTCSLNNLKEEKLIFEENINDIDILTSSQKETKLIQETDINHNYQEKEEYDDINYLEEYYCKFSVNGCNYKTLSNFGFLEAHEDSCMFRVKLCDRCGKPFFWKNMKKHDEECSEILLKCEECEITYFGTKNHICNEIKNTNKTCFDTNKEKINNKNSDLIKEEKNSSQEKNILNIMIEDKNDIYTGELRLIKSTLNNLVNLKPLEDDIHVTTTITKCHRNKKKIKIEIKRLKKKENNFIQKKRKRKIISNKKEIIKSDFNNIQKDDKINDSKYQICKNKSKQNSTQEDKYSDSKLFLNTSKKKFNNNFLNQNNFIEIIDKNYLNESNDKHTKIKESFEKNKNRKINDGEVDITLDKIYLKRFNHEKINNSNKNTFLKKVENHNDTARNQIKISDNIKDLNINKKKFNFNLDLERNYNNLEDNNYSNLNPNSREKTISDNKFTPSSENGNLDLFTSNLKKKKNFKQEIQNENRLLINIKSSLQKSSLFDKKYPSNNNLDNFINKNVHDYEKIKNMNKIISDYDFQNHQKYQTEKKNEKSNKNLKPYSRTEKINKLLNDGNDFDLKNKNKIKNIENPYKLTKKQKKEMDMFNFKKFSSLNKNYN